MVALPLATVHVQYVTRWKPTWEQATDASFFDCNTAPKSCQLRVACVAQAFPLRPRQRAAVVAKVVQGMFHPVRIVVDAWIHLPDVRDASASQDIV
jgi:hypothetical protein